MVLLFPVCDSLRNFLLALRARKGSRGRVGRTGESGIFGEVQIWAHTLRKSDISTLVRYKSFKLPSRGNTFASHCYDPGSTLGRMWDVFHPSQPMAGGFPWGFSSTLRRAWNCSIWNHLIRLTAWLELVLGDVKSTALPFTFTYENFHFWVGVELFWMVRSEVSSSSWKNSNFMG